MWVFDGEQWTQDDEEQPVRSKKHAPELDVPQVELEVLEIIPVSRPTRNVPPLPFP